MNSAMIRYVLGNVIKLEGLFLLLPCVISLIYQEKEGGDEKEWIVFTD